MPIKIYASKGNDWDDGAAEDQGNIPDGKET